MEDLDRTYSRDQQRYGDNLEAVATPVALVRSVTSRSQRSVKSARSRGSSKNRPEQSSRAAYLKNLEKDIGADHEKDEEDAIEKVETPEASRMSSVSGHSAESSEGRGRARNRVIRFEDGDVENPDNCMWFRIMLEKIWADL